MEQSKAVDVLKRLISGSFVEQIDCDNALKEALLALEELPAYKKNFEYHVKCDAEIKKLKEEKAELVRWLEKEINAPYFPIMPEKQKARRNALREVLGLVNNGE
jgi:hypothetical protein